MRDSIELAIAEPFPPDDRGQELGELVGVCAEDRVWSSREPLSLWSPEPRHPVEVVDPAELVHLGHELLALVADLVRAHVDDGRRSPLSPGPSARS